MRRLILLALVLLALPARAAEIRVLTAGAYKPVILALAPAFESESGHRLAVMNDTAGALAKRIAAGEGFDVAVLSPALVDEFAGRGLFAAGTRTDLARVGIGVAVREGAPAPDIGTVAAFKAAIEAAPSIALIDPKAGGSSGVYLAALFARLGLTEVVARKAVLVQGGLVAERVATGEAALGIHQISEILPVRGVRLVGPLPAEIQNETVYAAGIGARAADADAARALVRTLAGPQAAAVLAAKGMQPAR
jgi:molybdate transport system substrate-binding protein